MTTELERFEAKFVRADPAACWPWLASLTSGYGQFENSLDSSNTAHRYALIITVGSPPPGTEACHTCDNRVCVNPAHLYWGTRQDNADDARRRGRIPRGSARPNARLTEATVAEIRSRVRGGERGADLAREFGVHPNTVYTATSGRSWKEAA